MAGEMLCPDCGGVVGATETTSAGPPCSCFSSDNKLETALDMPSPAGPSQPKLCVLCGKDVAGHRRVKDSRGYVCYDCAKDEQRRERGGRVRCRSCGRLTKSDALVKSESGTKICVQCQADEVKARKQELRKLGIATAHKKFERGRLFLLLGIAALLFVIILLNKLKLLPH
jgi:hypothetical protein